MTRSQQLHNALLLADLWRVLALAFSPPTAKSLADLRGLSSELAAVLRAGEHPLRGGLADLAEAAGACDALALEHEHNALFSLDVMVPAYEGSYQLTERGAVVGDVAGYYKAFGLVAVDHSGPPDSLWNELALMSWLALKEGYAIERGLTDPLLVTRDAACEFLQTHLGRWAGVFAGRLLDTTDNPLYGTAAHLLLATVSLAADELGIVEIQPLAAREQTAEPDAVACPVACSPT